jgi:hypothetical protein
MRRSFGLAITLVIIFSGFSTTTASANGCSLAQTGTEVTGVGTCSGNITIPDGVTSIGRMAFQSSTITSVTIPNSVTTIVEYAFYNSRSLRSVTIGNGVTSIGDFAFDTNIALTSITFAADSALTSIGIDSFYNTSALTSITIPSGVTSIGDYAFYITGALSRVRFLGDVAPTVGTDAFFWYSPRTTRAIVNNDAAKATFTPIVAGKWNGLRVVTLAEANAEDAAVIAEQSASASREAARAADAQREVEKKSARDVILTKFKSSEEIGLVIFTQAEIFGITPQNIVNVQTEIAALPELSRVDITPVIKIARKYEVEGIIASDRVASIYSDTLIEIGLIPEDSKYKAALTAAIKKLPASERSSLADIAEVIGAEMAEIQARNDLLKAVLTRIAARRAS